MVKVGLVTGPFTPSARHAPRTKVVFPVPSSPLTSTRSPWARRAARSAPAASVSSGDPESILMWAVCAIRPGADRVPRRMSTLAVELSQHDDAVCVALAGELDLSSALTFEEQLRRIEDETRARVLVLDLSRLKFLDSTGLRLILAAHARAVK